MAPGVQTFVRWRDSEEQKAHSPDEGQMIKNEYDDYDEHKTKHFHTPPKIANFVSHDEKASTRPQPHFLQKSIADGISQAAPRVATLFDEKDTLSAISGESEEENGPQSHAMQRPSGTSLDDGSWARGSLTRGQHAIMGRMEAEIASMRGLPPGWPVNVSPYPSTTSESVSEAARDQNDPIEDQVVRDPGASFSPRIQAQRQMTKPTSHQGEVNMLQKETRPTHALFNESHIGPISRPSIDDEKPSGFVFQARVKPSPQIFQHQNRNVSAQPGSAQDLSSSRGQKRKVKVPSAAPRQVHETSTYQETGTNSVSPMAASNVAQLAVRTSSSRPATPLRSEQHDRRDIDMSKAQSGRDAPENHHSVEDTLHLDHQPPELYKMDYTTLRDEPFDQDSSKGQAHPLPTNEQEQSIQDQLGLIQVLSPEEQELFFASLHIDGWEEAGEWFVERFAEVFARLKKLRRDRRRAAQLFEKEIEQRHMVVEKKRRQTEEALTDMRSNGHRVLAMTPKKPGM